MNSSRESDWDAESAMRRFRKFAKSDAEIEAHLEQKRSEARLVFDEGLIARGFPARLVRHKSFVGDGWTRAKALIQRSLLKDGATWLLVGGRGGGKTAMGVELARWVMGQGRAPRFTYLSGLIDAMRADGAATTKRLTAPSLLVIDEVFADAPMTDWQRDALTTVVRLRHDAGKDTLMTSNGTRTATLKRIGPTISSRLSQGGVIVASWPSFRHGGGAEGNRAGQPAQEVAL